MRYEILDAPNGRVVNTIVADEIFVSAHYAHFRPAPSPPSAPVVAVVEMRQARLALHRAGLLTAVNAAVAAAGGEAQIEWEFAQTVRRDHVLVQTLGASLGLTEQQLDDLFVAAAAIE